MPPLPRLRIAALDDLARQLRFAPREALDRHIASAESLAEQLEPGGAYPEDWFVFRLTGYRPDIEDPASLVGEALLGDLSALVERLSLAAGHEGADAGPDALTIDQLAQRWSVSRKTIERYRRRGLIARRVTDGRNQRLVFPRANVEAFEAREGERVGRASTFSRIDEAMSERMIARAARYRSSLGYSLNEAAARLAERFDRSHEGVRQLLRKADERAQERGLAPVFSEPAPPSERERRVSYRAVRRGVEPISIARRLGRARVSVVRSINQARADLLLGLELQGPALVTFDREDAEEVLLSSSLVREGLVLETPVDLSTMAQDSRRRRDADAGAEQTRLIAYHYLRWATARDISRLDRAVPSGESIDTCETRLRWASLLKALLIESELHLVLASFDRAGHSTSAMPAPELRRAFMQGIDAIGAAIDRLDPTRGSRLASASAINLTRVTSAWGGSPRVDAPRRATPRLAAGARAPDWTRRIASWQRWLEPDPRIEGTLDRLQDRDALLLRRRFALDGAPPETLSQLSVRLQTSRVHTARFERSALRNALQAARAPSPGPSRPSLG